MLASFVVYLRPQEKRRLGKHTARALHGLFFDLLSSVAPEVADTMHGEQSKPFTVSPLIGSFEREGRYRVVTPENRYRVRYTVLSEPLVAALSRILMGHYVYDAPVDVAGTSYAIEGIGITPEETHGWAELSSCRKLFDERRHPQRGTSIRMRFSSPTAFKAGDLNFLFPLPQNVFGSYYRTWHEVADVALADDLLAFVEESVIVSRYDLHTDIIDAGRYTLIGFKGACTYRIMDDDPTYVGQLNALADFALFAGTGMKTTQGMGQTRRLT